MAVRDEFDENAAQVFRRSGLKMRRPYVALHVFVACAVTVVSEASGDLR